MRVGEGWCGWCQYLVTPGVETPEPQPGRITWLGLAYTGALLAVALGGRFLGVGDDLVGDFLG